MHSFEIFHQYHGIFHHEIIADSTLKKSNKIVTPLMIFLCIFIQLLTTSLQKLGMQTSLHQKALVATSK